MRGFNFRKDLICITLFLSFASGVGADETSRVQKSDCTELNNCNHNFSKEAREQQKSFVQKINELLKDIPYLTTLSPDAKEAHLRASGTLLITALYDWNPNLDTKAILADMKNPLNDMSGKATIDLSLQLFDAAFINRKPEFALIANKAIELVNPEMSKFISESLRIPKLNTKFESLKIGEDKSKREQFTTELTVDIQNTMSQAEQRSNPDLFGTDLSLSDGIIPLKQFSGIDLMSLGIGPISGLKTNEDKSDDSGNNNTGSMSGGGDSLRPNTSNTSKVPTFDNDDSDSTETFSSSENSESNSEGNSDPDIGEEPPPIPQINVDPQQPEVFQ